MYCTVYNEGRGLNGIASIATEDIEKDFIELEHFCNPKLRCNSQPASKEI
jgi:hypothetical protein